MASASSEVGVPKMSRGPVYFGVGLGVVNLTPLLQRNLEPFLTQKYLISEINFVAPTLLQSLPGMISSGEIEFVLTPGITSTEPLPP
jgi:hypothetical protein